MAGTTRNSRPERRVGTLLAGRYRLDRFVANGGMAQVWEATDETLRRRVAIKILHDHLADPKTLARFRAEGVTAARLTHPSVVAIFDTCSDQGLDAIVMEYVDGPTLRDVLDEDGPLSPERAVSVAFEIADALGAAHRIGLVHRDVKPANVLLCADGSVKVTDFGIAKMHDSGPDLTLPGTFLGTAKYLAPEQVEGHDVDARADVYALGVVLYEMLTGTVPFDGPTDAAIALARVQRDPRPMLEVAPDVPPQLDDVVRRALSRRATDRYPSMIEFRAALAAADLTARRDPRAVDGTQVLVTPPDARFVESERGWLIPAVFVTVVGVSLALAALLIGQSDAGQEIVRRARDAVGSSDTADTPTTVAADATVAVLRAVAFDPAPGDGAEHNEELVRVFDGDPTTTWTTEGYRARDFGIKSGVGLYVELTEPRALSELLIRSPTTGWSASIHVATSEPTTLEQWGAPVATADNVADNVRVDLDGRDAKFVLVWITQLDESSPARAAIGEVEVTAT